jgi:hypothetical protein
MTQPVSGGTAAGLGFTLTIDAPCDLAVNDNRVRALITIEVHRGDAAVAAGRTAEILIMDRSRSMMGQNKIHEARRAACAAIDVLSDGVLLGIIAGNSKAESVFPAARGLAAVNAETKAAAKRQVMSLRPEGGTEIGRWLAAAGELFATVPAAGVIRHAVLYSDGKNEHQTREELDATLSTCTDRFVCDVRGLGTDWDYAELLHIAEALHGDAVAVLRSADLADDFTRLMARARRLVVPRAYLRLRPDGRFRIDSIAQTHPVQADLTDQQRSADGTAIDVPLGAWEQETRRYELSLRFDPNALPMAEDVRATAVELLAETADGARERHAHAPLVVRRHDMPGFETVIPEGLTQVEKEREVTFAIKACANAGLNGRTAEADAELDKAIRLAREIDDVRLPLLTGLATIGPYGRSRLRPDVTRGQLQELGIESVRTGMRVITADPADEADQSNDQAGRPSFSARTCRVCGETTYAADPKGCEDCGALFEDEAAS